MEKILQLWSGDKDSTCAGDMHLERGDDVHFVCYIPMFDEVIPLIERCHYEHLMRCAEYYRSQGAKVTFTNGNLTYWEYCTKILSKGKRAGAMQSYPCFLKGKCGFNRDSKTSACEDVAKTIEYDFKDVGLCADEVNRKKLLPDEMSILQELGITKKMTFEHCKNVGRLSPTYYGNKKRDGCTLCPHGKPTERIQWFDDYNEFGAKKKLIELQRILKEDSRLKGTKQIYPMRGKHYFIENEEFVSPKGTRISLFGGDTIN